MKSKLICIWFMVMGILIMSGEFQTSKAEVNITDCFSVSGFLRYELGIHVGGMNPNNSPYQDENNSLNLSRSFLQTEWTYKPSEKFKLYANIRLTGDQTQELDGQLGRYDAFPVDVPKYGGLMMKKSNNDFRAEVWELYGDCTFGDTWLRLGKQQIVWGEMIGARILDAANALDRSWNFQFDLDEFDLIRIPAWSIRGSQNIKQNCFKFLKDLNIEAFVTPGDIYPNINPEPGAPYNIFAFPAIFNITNKDNRGKTAFGVRVGGLIGQVYGTLNYMHLYNYDFVFDFKRFRPPGPLGPPALFLDAEYPAIDLYGTSLNYAMVDPYNLVITFEGSWIPDKPYQQAGTAFPEVQDKGTCDYAIRFQRPTQLVPPTFLHASFTDIQLQFGQTVIEGDPHKILGPNNSKIDRTTQRITFQIRQPLMYNNLTPGFQIIYDSDNAYWIKPSINYRYGNHWYFDVFGAILGGSEHRPGRFGSMYWADTVYMRATFQF